MLTVYGNHVSFFSKKVRLVANALDLDYEYVELDLGKGEAQTEAHKKRHPAGKIPVIVDEDGFTLFESDAIIRYLADKQSSSLYPHGLKERAIVDQWNQFVSSHISNALLKVFFNRVLAPKRGLAVDEQSLADGIKFLARFLPIVDEQLGQFPYLAGAKMTLADLNLLANVDSLEAVKIDLSPYKYLLTWRDKLRQQPFYQRLLEETATA